MPIVLITGANRGLGLEFALIDGSSRPAFLRSMMRKPRMRCLFRWGS